MTDIRKRLTSILETSLLACRSWLDEDENGDARLIDPLTGGVVPSHYGDSHLAAALVILGQMRGDARLLSQGVSLAETVVRNWTASSQKPDFHHDFNNFAMCLVEECVRRVAPGLSTKIQGAVLTTPDSAHATINWLPMRAYVNRARYDWRGDNRHATAAEHAIETIRLATNNDGGIEDRLPFGSSYNLQYNISSLAGLSFYSRKWPIDRFHLGISLGFLLNSVLPDGDINYVGRGTNQIFAWGPWLYALASAGELGALDAALTFLSDRYERALERRNLFLNESPGEEKLFWWDYHFCSVYHAHFLFWTVLAVRDLDTACVQGAGKAQGRTRLVDSGGTGLRLKRVDIGGAAIFEGRHTYLAEAGPSLCALWHSDKGMLFKGGLGPWQGAFGKQYSFADTVFQNHFGLISQEALWPFMDGRLARKLFPGIIRDRAAVLRPAFAPIAFCESKGALSIAWETVGHTGYLNVPILDGGADAVEIELSVDGRRLDGALVGKIRSQYGWNRVTRSHPAQGRRWEVTIR